MTGDPERVKNVELVSKECASVVGADRYASKFILISKKWILFWFSCDTAVQIMQCVGKAAVAHGLDPAKDLM